MLKKVTTTSFISIFSVFFVLLTNLSALANTDTFYGQNSLNSLMDGEKIMLILPGGAKVGATNQKTTYALTDHSQSNRLAVTDNTITELVTYTPFGDTETKESNLTQYYTGMIFEPETATYDYHARRYDPTVARFTGVDAIRQSISPYSYTENNPINFVDPNGLGKVTFFLYSLYGDRVKNDAGPDIVKPMKSEILPILEKNFSSLVKTSSLERPTYLEVDGGDTIDHLIIAAHGVPESKSIILHSNETGRKTQQTGEDFAVYLRDRLQAINPRAIREVKSICLQSCAADYHAVKSRRLFGLWEEYDTSFAEVFRDNIKELLPDLRNVVATRYNSTLEISPKNSSLMHIRFNNSYLESSHHPKNNGDNNYVIEYTVDTEKYLTGDLPLKLFQTPSSLTVDRSGKAEFDDFPNYKLKYDTHVNDDFGLELRHQPLRELFVRSAPLKEMFGFK